MSRKKRIFFAGLILVAGALVIGIRSLQTSPESQNQNVEDRGAGEPKSPVDSTTATAVTTTTSTLKKAARAPGANAKGKSQNLKDYLKSADPLAQWSLSHSSSGEVTAISGGLIQQDILDSEKALVFAKTMAQLLGLDAGQVVMAEKQLPENADTRSMNFSQEIDGYLVFGSSMSVFTRKKDGAIYYITNEMQKFENVETRISFGLNEAEQAVQAIYVNAKGFKIEGRQEKPVIVANDSNKGELCWPIQIRLEKPRFERRILFVSAKDLSLVRDVNLVVQN